MMRCLYQSKIPAETGTISVDFEIVDLTKSTVRDIDRAGGAERDLVGRQCPSSFALEDDNLPVRTAPNAGHSIDLNSHHVIASIASSNFRQGDVLQLSLRKNGFRHYRYAFGLPLGSLRALDHHERNFPVLDLAGLDFSAGHWLEEVPIGAEVLLRLSPRREVGLQRARETAVPVRNTERNRLRSLCRRRDFGRTDLHVWSLWVRSPALRAMAASEDLAQPCVHCVWLAELAQKTVRGVRRTNLIGQKSELFAQRAFPLADVSDGLRAVILRKLCQDHAPSNFGIRNDGKSDWTLAARRFSHSLVEDPYEFVGRNSSFMHKFPNHVRAGKTIALGTAYVEGLGPHDTKRNWRVCDVR